MRWVAFFSLLPALIISVNSALADIVKDSKIELEARNMYINNDNRSDPAAQSKFEQWGQSFIVKGESGYTEGKVGVGIDALALWAFRLNAKKGNNSVGAMFPYHDDGTIEKSFASLRPTLKAKIYASEAKVGALQPSLPILLTNDGRILPEVYRGAALEIKDIPDLNLNLGYIDRVQGRNSTDYQRLKSAGAATHYSDRFLFAGGDYTFIPEINLAYYFAQLQDFYNQHYVGFKGNFKLGGGLLQPDVRYFNSKDEGSSYIGRVNNNLYSGLLTYTIASHSFSGGLQKITGDGAFPHIDPGQTVAGISTGTAGATTYTIADVQINNFLKQKERTWLAKYNYDFSELGVKGLSFTAMYLSADQVSGSKTGDNEWERDIVVSYVIPDGKFKNLGFTWKNAAYRTNISGSNSIDENRLIISYKASFF